MSETRNEPRKKNFRGDMPLCSAFIDDMRAAFGADDINRQQKRGMAGDPVFWASEGGREIGTRPEAGREFPAVLQVLPDVVIKGRRK